MQFLQSTSSSVVESYICLIQFANCCNHAVRGSVVWKLTPDSTLLVCSSDLLYSCSWNSVNSGGVKWFSLKQFSRVVRRGNNIE